MVLYAQLGTLELSERSSWRTIHRKRSDPAEDELSQIDALACIRNSDEDIRMNRKGPALVALTGAFLLENQS